MMASKEIFHAPPRRSFWPGQFTGNFSVERAVIELGEGTYGRLPAPMPPSQSPENTIRPPSHSRDYEYGYHHLYDDLKPGKPSDNLSLPDPLGLGKRFQPLPKQK
jgi:hypothetical protein